MCRSRKSGKSSKTHDGLSIILCALSVKPNLEYSTTASITKNKVNRHPMTTLKKAICVIYARNKFQPRPFFCAAVVAASALITSSLSMRNSLKYLCLSSRGTRVGSVGVDGLTGGVWELLASIIL